MANWRKSYYISLGLFLTKCEENFTTKQNKAKRVKTVMDRPMMTSCDDGVISTNDDASACKRHAVRVGYWKDDYIGSFVSNTDRKAPEINRGYYARVKGIEVCIDKFLEVMHLLKTQIQTHQSMCLYLMFIFVDGSKYNLGLALVNYSTN